MIEANGKRDVDRVDERDTMFARMARRMGTAAHDDYYRRHPELLRTDERLRSRPRLGRPGGRYYDEAVCREAMELFNRIEDLVPERSVVERWASEVRNAANPTSTVKAMARELGAVSVGCASLDQAYVYTHKGRFDEDYGRPIDLVRGNAVVFLVEMNWDAMRRAPRAETLRESARQYLRAARIAKVVAAAIRASGHSAKPHYDAHYDAILPPLAVQAGLGELGRNNILIADRYGSRVRIGAVTTDLDLRLDSPRSLGARQFCTICNKCADNCPANALSHEDLVEVRGVRRWTTHAERCYGYWRSAGTDCGICMAVCPFSHRDQWFHRLVRFIVARAPAIHRLALWCDDAIYGRRWHALD